MDVRRYQQPDVIRRALAERRVAVVGLSSNELRASNFVGFYLQRHGYEIVPVNPREEEIFGVRCYPSLSASVPERAAALPGGQCSSLDDGARGPRSFCWPQLRSRVRQLQLSSQTARSLCWG